MYHKNMNADFGYNILEQLLVGDLDGEHFEARAVSGGRAGSKVAGAVDLILANNPYLTGVKKQGSRPGGAIIMGKYRMRTHESRSNWIRLDPIAGNDMKGRAGFAIHGRGQRGSDGCIVPADFKVVLQLCALLEKREQEGKAAPVLAAYAIGDFDGFDRSLAQRINTA